jgi:hypothetical protein
MHTDDFHPNPLKDPKAPLEEALIDEFLRAGGYDWRALDRLPDVERTRLFQHAAAYAALRLAEVEARARFVHELHGR